VARAEELGVGAPAAILREVDAINMRQRARTVDLAFGLLGGGATGGEIAVLGASFKADSDDVRDSPALDIAATMQARGAHVRVYDPAANANAHRAKPRLAVSASIEDACRDADLTVVATDWDEFRAIDPVALGDVVRRPRVIDGRLALDPDKWRAAGWDFHALGRGSR
jgi:UDPglucose 6-dehydrogenase